MSIPTINTYIVLLTFILGGFSPKAFTSNLSDSDEEFKKWNERYSSPTKHPSDVPTTSLEYDSAHKGLINHQKPLANRGEVHLGEIYKGKCVTQQETVEGEGVCYIGPKHVNYVQFNENSGIPSYESYGVPQKKDSQIDKGEYSRNHPEFVEVYSLSQGNLISVSRPNRTKVSKEDDIIVFDPGHGVDHAFTITHKGSNSTRDVRNFTPQTLYYNRSIRNPLTGDISKRGNTYKEIAIYPESPLSITRSFKGTKFKTPLPIGFVFVELSEEDIEHAYYFPNLINYKQLPIMRKKQKGVATWKQLAEHFKISREIVKDIWGHEEITTEDKRRVAQRSSQHIGYRSLSGRYEILSESQVWPSSARNALVRTAAIYRMERTAEYDKSIENMLQVAQIFNDQSFIYYEFDGTLHIPALATYWTKRALEEIKRKDYPAEDIFYLMQYEPQIPLEPSAMGQIITAFEEKLSKTPSAEYIIKLLQYFEDKKNEGKYAEWSTKLTHHVREEKEPGSIVINDSNLTNLINALSDTNMINIILDFKVTSQNLSSVLAGFKQRAIREQSSYERNLNFIEFKHIRTSAFLSIMEAFEDGVDHNGRVIGVDVLNTAIKLPSYNRTQVQKYVKKHYPKTHVMILN